jgi:hypothetical protein
LQQTAATARQEQQQGTKTPDEKKGFQATAGLATPALSPTLKDTLINNKKQRKDQHGTAAWRCRPEGSPLLRTFHP